MDAVYCVDCSKVQCEATMGRVFIYGIFLLLISIEYVSAKLFHKMKLNSTDGWLVLFNNITLYLAALFVFGYSFNDVDISIITFIVSAFIGVQSITFHYLWPEEKLLKQGLAALSLFFFVIFIAFNWEGLTVTLLWLLTAVLIFSLGVYRKSVPLRMTAILLMGLTLLKLLALDSISFSPVQKIISYVVLGVLLLVVSFFYQKFKKQLFEE